MKQIFVSFLFICFLLLNQSTLKADTSPNSSITIFAHGLGGHAGHIRRYQEHRIIHGDAHTFDVYGRMSQVSLGQQHEMGNLDNAIQHIVRTKLDNQIILRGLSMGAATIANYLGSYPDTSAIKGAILESPFADVDGILNDIINKSFSLSVINAICPYFKELGVYCIYRNHTLDGIQPIKVAHLIPKHIPILLIASQEDTLIPLHSTQKMYNALVQSGHTKTHILIVKHGAHAKMCFHKKSYKTIRNVEHAFRKKYNLGNYINSYAIAGEQALAATQPAVSNSEDIQ
ncbi:MAG: alpha/beta hydrolase [Candidatus Dependentiae bacterium]|nr:alpha/beta hydrolase [Candidatus Dependentiae bacterium]